MSEGTGRRVGVVTTSYPRESGDPAGGFVAEHARWLVRQGYAVDVIAAGPGVATDRAISIERIDSPLFYGEGAPDRLARNPGYWLEAARFSARLARAIRRRSPQWDRVVAHWLAPCGVAAALACRGRPLTAIAHSGDVHLLRRTGMVRPALAALERARARLVFVTAGLRDALVPDPSPLSTSVCSMGIDIARFEAIERQPSDPAMPTVLFLGRLVPVKGIDVLLEAMAALARPARLVVAGGGPLLDALRARAVDSAVFVGEVTTFERDALLGAADLLVLPSVHVEGGRSEGLPVTVLEAMAAGVPVIASRAGGLAELLPDVARLVPPRDPAALAAAIDRALAAPDPARLARARAFARTRDWDRVGPLLLGD